MSALLFGRSLECVQQYSPRLIAQSSNHFLYSDTPRKKNQPLCAFSPSFSLTFLKQNTGPSERVGVLFFLILNLNRFFHSSFYKLHSLDYGYNKEGNTRGDAVLRPRDGYYSEELGKEGNLANGRCAEYAGNCR